MFLGSKLFWPMKVIVVGAGLAGLTCAKASREGGVVPGVFLAGECAEGSRINGSTLPGEKAAREVLG